MIYLDHAATSFPKPPTVLAAVEHWFRDIGVSPSRGDGTRCRAAGTLTESVRVALAKLCGVRRERVAFTSGATESANLLLRGLLREGDRVVTTAAEHSAVARPLRALERERALQLEIVPVDRHGEVDPAAVERALRAQRTRLLVLNHGSNVTGVVQDAATLCALARAQGCLSAVDASQTAGVLPLSTMRADAYFASAHKSLLAPPGLGFLAAGDGLQLTPGKQGGTGSSVALDTQPGTWPEGFEPGTPNGPAIAGLGAALTFIEARGAHALLRDELAVVDALRSALVDRLGDRVRLIGRADGARVAILSFTLQDLDPAEAGLVLDAADIHVRTGFHCAPWIHKDIGTTQGGCIRVSPGPFTATSEALAVVRALAP